MSERRRWGQPLKRSSDAYLYSSADCQFAGPTPPTDGLCVIMWQALPSLESTRKIRNLLASTHLGLGLLPRCALLAGLPRHTGGTRAWTDSKSFARKPRLEDAPDDV